MHTENARKLLSVLDVKIKLREEYVLLKTILTYGTFDLFHVGHVRLLRRLKSSADRLVVGCSTDEFNQLKGKKCIFPYSDRSEILESCQYVDQVFPEESWEQKVDDIKKYDVDTFAIGDDWAGEFDFLETEGHCRVIYLPRTQGISTTDVRSTVNHLRKDEISGIINTLRDVEKRLQTL